MKKRNIWKLASFALMFILLVTGAVGLVTWAADQEQGFDMEDIEVDYINETMTVTIVGSDYPTAEFDKNDFDTIVYYTDRYVKDVSRWNACEVRERNILDEDGKVIGKEAVAAFDISWVDDNKTVRIYLCGDKVNKKVVAVDLTWEENFAVSFTGTLLCTDITEAETWKEIYKDYPNFSEDTGYFIFTLEENGRANSYFDLDSILWRKGNNGVWREFAELDLKEMNIRGIKLEFQIKASNAEVAEDATANDAVAGNTVVGARASSIARCSVAKLSDAPKVLVNTDLMTIGIDNGMEFSFDKEEWIMVPDYDKKFGTEEILVAEETREKAIEKIFTNEKITELLIQELYKTKAEGFTMNSPMDRESLEEQYKDDFTFTNEGIVLYVREIGTQRKAASKIAKVMIPYAAEGMASASEEDLEISYGESKTNTGGIIIANKSDMKYQVAILTGAEYDAAPDKEDLDITELKWTSIKPGKTLKLTNKKVPEGAYLLYRIAGENGQLPSSYETYGPVMYDGLTYAGIASSKKNVGDELTASVSTNLKIEDANLKFQWQVCEDVKAAEPVWTNIEGATKSTYKLTSNEVNKYVRVSIQYKEEKPLASDYIGPVKN